MTGSTFSPLSVILTSNKLTGPNYVDWRRNLDIVLTAEDYSIALTEAQPETPAADASQELKDQHKRWTKANTMARCYILASMSNVLQHQHKNMPTAHEIILSLREMFAE